MIQIPLVTIFVRHGSDCPQRDELYRRCACRKHLRWSHNGKQYRKTAKTRSWAGAERAKREVELSYENAASGKPAQPDEAVSVERAVQLFLQNKAGQNMAPVTLRKYRRELERFQHFCDRQGRYFLQEIRLPDLTEFRSTWEQEYPSSLTRQKVQERLRGFFTYALKAELLSRSPAASLSTIKVDVAPTLPLDAADYKALLKAVPKVISDPTKAAKVHALIRCMRFTALAIGDAVTLERDKLKWDAARQTWRVVTARAKTGVDVSVAIPPDVAQEMLALVNGNMKYFFWNRGEGQPQTAAKNWSAELRPVFAGAGLPDGHSHQLRDTAAVEWLNAGIRLEDVSRLLGHASVRTTEKHYAPWVKSRQDRLDDLVVATWEIAAGSKVMSFEDAKRILRGLVEMKPNGGLTSEQRSELAALVRQVNERIVPPLRRFDLHHRISQETRTPDYERCGK
jgi:integrase/recombinase XerD